MLKQTFSWQIVQKNVHFINQAKLGKTLKYQLLVPSGFLLFTLFSSVRVFYPYFQGFMEGRSLLVVYGFYFSQLFQEVPHGTKGTGPRFVTRPVYSRSQPQEQHEHRCCSSSTNVFISYSLYTVRRYCTSPGAPDLRARLG